MLRVNGHENSVENQEILLCVDHVGAQSIIYFACNTWSVTLKEVPKYLLQFFFYPNGWSLIWIIECDAQYRANQIYAILIQYIPAVNDF